MMGVFSKLTQMAEERVARIHIKNNPGTYKSVKNDPLILVPREEIRKMSKNFDAYYDISDFPKQVPIPESYIKNKDIHGIRGFAVQCMLDKRRASLPAKTASLLSMAGGLTGILTATAVGAITASASTIAIVPVGTAITGYAGYKTIQKIKDLINHTKEPTPSTSYQSEIAAFLKQNVSPEQKITFA